MANSKTTISRRKLLTAIAAGTAVGLPLTGRSGQAPLPDLPADIAPSVLAQDENYWAEVARHYDRSVGIVNLEHGYQ